MRDLWCMNVSTNLRKQWGKKKKRTTITQLVLVVAVARDTRNVLDSVRLMALLALLKVKISVECQIAHLAAIASAAAAAEIGLVEGHTLHLC